ncbi:MAG TPA: GNAT family N-acetyltransferase [Bryobacteraceae bacterium]|nr:GNAT family N-acetyltransferase [Bryobacteraceae bacterium]
MTDLRQAVNTHSRIVLSLRPEEPRDREFLARLFASTREQEMQLTGWTSEQQAAFLSMQFQAQTMHYNRIYAGAARCIVLVDDNPAGRLYVFQGGGELRIVDISLLPQYRGRGVGTTVLRSVIDQAESAGLCVSLNVAVFNPARRLYEQLGFQQTGPGDGVYLPMRRRAKSGCRVIPEFEHHRTVVQFNLSYLILRERFPPTS